MAKAGEKLRQMSSKRQIATGIVPSFARLGFPLSLQPRKSRGWSRSTLSFGTQISDSLYKRRVGGKVIPRDADALDPLSGFLQSLSIKCGGLDEGTRRLAPIAARGLVRSRTTVAIDAVLVEVEASRTPRDSRSTTRLPRSGSLSRSSFLVRPFGSH